MDQIQLILLCLERYIFEQKDVRLRMNWTLPVYREWMRRVISRQVLVEAST